MFRLLRSNLLWNWNIFLALLAYFLRDSWRFIIDKLYFWYRRRSVLEVCILCIVASVRTNMDDQLLPSYVIHYLTISLQDSIIYGISFLSVDGQKITVFYFLKDSFTISIAQFATFSYLPITILQLLMNRIYFLILMLLSTYNVLFVLYYVFLLLL